MLSKSVSDYANFATALSTIGSTTAILFVDQAVTLAANTTVASNISLAFSNVGSINVSTYTLEIDGPCFADIPSVFSGSGAITLVGPFSSSAPKIFTGSSNITINGAFTGGLFQIFSGTGTVNFAGSQEVYPNWWAHWNSDDNTANTATIQSAIDALSNSTNSYSGGTVIIPAGFKYYTSFLDIDGLIYRGRVNIVDRSDSETYKIILNGETGATGQSAGANNVLLVRSAQHPAYILDSISTVYSTTPAASPKSIDTLDDDQQDICEAAANPPHAASVLWCVDGKDNWQLCQDINFNGDYHLCLYSNNAATGSGNIQTMTYYKDGHVQIGRPYIAQDFTNDSSTSRLAFLEMSEYSVEKEPAQVPRMTTL